MIDGLQTTCPHCGCSHDAATGTAPWPSTGDVSVCINCQGTSVFVAGPCGVALRPPTPDEAVRIGADDRVIKMIVVARAVKGRRYR